MRKPTAEDVKAYRELHQCGMMEAKRILTKDYLAELVRSATSIEDLKEPILFLLGRDGD